MYNNVLLDEQGQLITSDEVNINKSSKTILPYMKGINIPENLKHRAEHVYMLMGSPVKKDTARTADSNGIGINKRKLIFCCIHFAYAEMDIIHSPKRLAVIVGIPFDKMFKTIGKYSLNKTDYHPPQRFYSIYEHSKYLINELNYDLNILPYVELICNAIENKFPLLDVAPDLIAMSIIIYLNKKWADNLPSSSSSISVGHSGKWSEDTLIYELSKYVTYNNKKITEITNKYIETLK